MAAPKTAQPDHGRGTPRTRTIIVLAPARTSVLVLFDARPHALEAFPLVLVGRRVRGSFALLLLAGQLELLLALGGADLGGVADDGRAEAGALHRVQRLE